MAKPKVFVTQIGFFEVAVAATSKKAALAAFGVRQDLFAHGEAAVSTDPAAAAALARPGLVLRRPAGSKGRFEVQPSPPATPVARRREKPPSRAPIQKLERRIAALEEAHAAAVQKIHDQQAQLEAREADLRSRHETERQDLEVRLDAAKRAWRAAAAAKRGPV